MTAECNSGLQATFALLGDLNNSKYPQTFANEPKQYELVFPVDSAPALLKRLEVETSKTKSFTQRAYITKLFTSIGSIQLL